MVDASAIITPLPFPAILTKCYQTLSPQGVLVSCKVIDELLQALNPAATSQIFIDLAKTP